MEVHFFGKCKQNKFIRLVNKINEHIVYEWKGTFRSLAKSLRRGGGVLNLTILVQSEINFQTEITCGKPSFETTRTCQI